MNSISDMIPKCRIERSSSCYNNTSSTSVLANDSLDLYPVPTPGYENLLYFISYTQSILSKIVSYTLVNHIHLLTLHRPLWEHGEQEGGSGNSFVQGLFGVTPDGSGYNSNNLAPSSDA
jgi:hypothetical protein